jgi:predicted RNA-binding Zn ribbon-like protein
MKFEYIGGNLALDFANTTSHRETESPRERLQSYADLLAWAEGAGGAAAEVLAGLQSEAEAHPEAASRALEQARALRESIYRVFHAFPPGPGEAFSPAADLARINAICQRAKRHRELRLRRNARAGGPRFEWAWNTGAGALDRVLWPVAVAAGDLLTGADPRRVKECGGEHCNWLFLDQSKNRSRRWCTMQDCGNRVKARRHHAKRTSRVAQPGSG